MKLSQANGTKVVDSLVLFSCCGYTDGKTDTYTELVDDEEKIDQICRFYVIENSYTKTLSNIFHNKK